MYNYDIISIYHYLYVLYCINKYMYKFKRIFTLIYRLVIICMFLSVFVQIRKYFILLVRVCDGLCVSKCSFDDFNV